MPSAFLWFNDQAYLVWQTEEVENQEKGKYCVYWGGGLVYFIDRPDVYITNENGQGSRCMALVTTKNE